MNRTATPNKRAWFIVFGALVMTVPTYAAACYIITQTRKTPPAPNLPTLQLRFDALALLGLLVSIAWLHSKTLGKIGESGKTVMLPQQFQTYSIVALALAETCVISGLLLFFSGDALRNFVPFALGTLAVDFAFILPKGIRYWAAWEVAQQPRGPSPFEDLK